MLPTMCVNVRQMFLHVPILVKLVVVVVSANVELLIPVLDSQLEHIVMLPIMFVNVRQL